MDEVNYCWKHDAEYYADGTWCETRCLDTQCTYCALRAPRHLKGCACTRNYCCMCWEELSSWVTVQDGEDARIMCHTCSQEFTPAL